MWLASGAVLDLQVAVEARGILPSEIELVVGVDPEPYILGRAID
jgi:hypothetical protein